MLCVHLAVKPYLTTLKAPGPFLRNPCVRKYPVHSLSYTGSIVSTEEFQCFWKSNLNFSELCSKAGKKEEKRNIIQTCLDLMRLLWNRLISLGFAGKKKLQEKKRKPKYRVYQFSTVYKSYTRSPEFASDAVVASYSRVTTWLIILPCFLLERGGEKERAAIYLLLLMLICDLKGFEPTWRALWNQQ